MKKFSKFLAVLLALVMCVSLLPMAFASEAAPTSGKITITNSTQGATYTAWKIFDATVAKDADGNDIISYLATATQKEGYEDLGEENPFTFTGPNSDDMYTVAVKEGKEGDVIGFLKAHMIAQKDGDEKISGYECDLPGAEEGKSQTGNNGELVFDGLEFGYYFITSTVGAVVTITSTNPDATVIDKNQQPTFNKTMEGATTPDTQDPKLDIPSNEGAIGDVIDYTISADATQYDADSEKPIVQYYIYDKLDSGLKYHDGDVVVKVGEKTLTAGSEYTFKWWNGDDEVESFEKADSFSILIPWAVLKDNGSLDHFIYDGSVNKIEITYRGEIDTDAALAIPGNHNTAEFRLNHEVTDGPTPDTREEWGEKKDEKKTVTYTYALGIMKVNPDLTALADAEFEIYTNKDEDGSLTGKIYAVENMDGTYTYYGTYENDEALPLDHPEVTSTFVTNAQGTITLKGVDKGTYWAKETKAPNGYNLIADPFSVTADTVIGKTESTQGYKSSWYVEYDEDGKVVNASSTYEEFENYKEFNFGADVKVVGVAALNMQGTVLPSTGGIGTTIFYVVGGALVLAAVVLLVTKKRMVNKVD